MIQDKKEKERSILDDFINGYDDFPKGQIRCNEAPDFILHINRRKSIGIELTELLHPQAKTSNWRTGEGSMINEFTKEIINDTIIRKEEKLSHYKKKRLDIYWLIIWTNYLDRSSSFNYRNKLENWEFSSQFHKIFIFDAIIKKIFELNLIVTKTIL